MHAKCKHLGVLAAYVQDGVDVKAIHALVARLVHASSGANGAKALPPQQLLYALGAIAKLEPTTDVKQLFVQLASATTHAAKRLTANRLGIAAWALSRPNVLSALPAGTRTAWRDALTERLAQDEVRAFLVRRIASL